MKDIEDLITSPNAFDEWLIFQSYKSQRNNWYDPETCATGKKEAMKEIYPKLEVYEKMYQLLKEHP